MMQAAWRTPRDLLEYLDACQVHLFVGRYVDTGRPRLSIVADPHCVVDRQTLEALRYWETDLAYQLLEQRRIDSDVPNVVTFGVSRSGKLTMHYRQQGFLRRFWLADNGTWKRYV
jgi:hypothetical protein